MEEETRFRVCDLLQMVDFCLHLYKCDVHSFVYEEHGDSMVVARFKIAFTMKEKTIVATNLSF